MALLRMILVPQEMCETRSKASPPPVKTILNSKDHTCNIWTTVRLHQEPFLKSEKQKRGPIPIVEIGVTQPSLKRIQSVNE